jgi:hypothetical protein
VEAAILLRTKKTARSIDLQIVHASKQNQKISGGEGTAVETALHCIPKSEPRPQIEGEKQMARGDVHGWGGRGGRSGEEHHLGELDRERSGAFYRPVGRGNRARVSLARSAAAARVAVAEIAGERRRNQEGKNRKERKRLILLLVRVVGVVGLFFVGPAYACAWVGGRFLCKSTGLVWSMGDSDFGLVALENGTK